MLTLSADGGDASDICADVGGTDAAAAEADCSSVTHVMQVQLQVSCKCAQHHERVRLCLYARLVTFTQNII